MSLSVFLGKCIQIGSNVTLELRTGEKVRCQSPSQFICVGDVVHGSGSLSDELLTFSNPPIIIIPNTIENIRSFFTSEMKRGNVFDELRRVSGVNGMTIDEYLDRACLGNRSRTIHGLTANTKFSAGLCKLIFDIWYRKRLMRKFYLLGLSYTEVKEAQLFFGAGGKLYDDLCKNVHRHVSIPCMKRSHIQRMFGLGDPDKSSPVAEFLYKKICSGNTCIPHRLMLKMGVIDRDELGEYGVIPRGDYWYMRRTLQVEEDVASRLITKIGLPKMEVGELTGVESTINLSADQRQAVATALSHHLSVITGGPGTGKSRIICEIIKMYDSLKETYVVSSFTGKAVARIKELGGKVHAATIDRLITKGDASFSHLIIDEASMVTSELMSRFFSVYDPSRYTITLVGDLNQLPPIGWGKFLTAIIRCGRVPVSLLRHNFRSEGSARGVIINSQELISGRRDKTVPMDWYEDDNFVTLRGDVSTVEKIIRGFKEAGHPVDDLTVITPINSDVDALNRAVQSVYGTGSGYESRGFRWEIGDRVMMTKNCYDRGIMNGDVGIVSSLEGEGLSVKFTETNTVFFPYDAPKFLASEEDVDPRDIWIGYLRHAFAVTVHKSQGSEYPISLVYLSPGSALMSNISLIYTAITRASKACWIIHGGDALFQATSREIPFRYDRLEDRLRESHPDIVYGVTVGDESCDVDDDYCDVDE